MVVCQQYERLNTSERFKEELIAKINHIENRAYFMKKIRNLEQQHTDAMAETKMKPKSDDIDFKMDFNELKEKITKTAEIAETYFKEREVHRKAQASAPASPSKVPLAK